MAVMYAMPNGRFPRQVTENQFVRLRPDPTGKWDNLWLLQYMRAAVGSRLHDCIGVINGNVTGRN